MTNKMREEHQRSMKRGKWYWVDKSVIQERARTEGLLTISVYHFLASMADESQACYPSQKYVAKRLGCSRGSVNKAIKRLVRGGMISMEKGRENRPVYHLLPLGMSGSCTGMSDTETPDVQNEDTNNNKGTRNNNNNVVSVQKTSNGRDSDADVEAKRELLARDIADGLGDNDHLGLYLSYAGKYAEGFLRRVLAETRLTPEAKIRKSRAALFKYLVNYYEGKGN